MTALGQTAATVARCAAMKKHAGFDIVAIAGSAGGVAALKQIVGELDPHSPPVVVIQHLPLVAKSNLVAVLSRQTRRFVKWAEHGDALKQGTIYVAPQMSQVTVESNGRLSVLSCYSRHLGTPAADPLLESIAKQFGPRAIAVVLSGLLSDGATGIQALKRCGGTVLIQSPDTALAPRMPEAAIETMGLHFILPLNKIPLALAAMFRRDPTIPLRSD
jgi:two-component system, chemotaxis family, protein-glutamate methylesterase/glutaminase